MSETVVVIDSSKLFQLLNFTCLQEYGRQVNSPLKRVIEEARRRNWLLKTTEVNLRRAKRALARKLRLPLSGEELEMLLNIAEGRIRLFVEVINKEYYLEKLPQAVELLEDREKEPEDAHALALAMALVEQGYQVILWANDDDFTGKQALIARLGIELRNKLVD
ncbi:hypothetical protein Theam_1779 (plasmid) [Thermovibrio ammonificans HB-1]|uniref:PIN domain-containing protein n=1 Tax=Thermovibrio ammonificans (strain DSM 15698 / JCM 12110 / HB-1) TaxID=648996 RepID=E8T6R2_THEA1|nr:PIN domain-containing protein [Thermovibrio ammonificans]ADU97735.1 hypothetical protein Theam_1779 [Thermovibrio ammonificans HB-1]